MLYERNCKRRRSMAGVQLDRVFNEGYSNINHLPMVSFGSLQALDVLDYKCLMTAMLSGFRVYLFYACTVEVLLHGTKAGAGTVISSDVAMVRSSRT